MSTVGEHHAPPALVQVTPSQTCSDAAWEAAYRRFESPEEEVAKFLRRLRWFGVEDVEAWPRDLAIAELFCGRGNGLVAWQQLGFPQLEGVDLSEDLLAEYHGPARCYIADCRQLPFEDESKDVVAIQGGLHHLPDLLPDLRQTLDEAARVLRPGGRLLVVEPWNTLFLRLVHWASSQPLLRQMWDKLDAFEQLYQHEQETYDRWRESPEVILEIFRTRFHPLQCQRRWGKFYYLGACG